jgi:hypothetical protein
MIQGTVDLSREAADKLFLANVCLNPGIVYIMLAPVLSPNTIKLDFLLYIFPRLEFFENSLRG